MLRVELLSLYASIIGLALAVQIPFTSGTNLRLQEGNQDSILGNDRPEWSLDRPPHPNDTDHLVFETVYSLLQHWPNTRTRNGHNIVPGIIPKGTLLYRGGNDDKLPPGADWVATDPEHSLIFCRDGSPPSSVAQGCWHLTLVTTRPLKIVYFDGSSAAKIPHGSMDTQDLFAWGVAGFDFLFYERERIDALCEWGKKFGVDAFVRMEMDFEAMLCDFTSGVSVLSFANLVSRGRQPPLAEGKPDAFEVVNSGSWHNHYPGETRIQLDLARLISFYDTQRVPSLVPIRAGQERWDHRVGNISSEDLAAVKGRLEAILVRPSDLSSGIEWKTLFQVIVDRFAGRLELTRHLLNSRATNSDEILDRANKVHTQLRIMLTPYILLSAAPKDPLDKTDLDWTIPIYKFCATIHTEALESELDSMTESEKLLFQAMQGTSREICRVVTKMWAAGVYAGLDAVLNTKESPDITEITQLWNGWEEDLSQLMTWLDWSVWVKCDPGCDSNELCYLPTWPIGFPRNWRYKHEPPTDPDRPRHPKRPTSFELRAMAMEDFAERMQNVINQGPDDWIRPQPRCIPRIAPYGF